jgi:uncharacterized membrane protein
VWPWSLPALGLPALAVAALLLVGLTIWTYRGVANITPRRLRAILGLRLAALALVVFMLLRPSVLSRDDLRLPSTLLLLIDASESMTIQDEFNGQSRWDYLRRLLTDCERQLERLRDDQNVTVVPYRFGADLGPYDANIKPDGKRTDFGQALHSLAETHGQDRNLRGLVILSDGADNGTRYPALTEAARFRTIPCPIHTFGLGKPTTAERQRDIAFTSINPEPATVAVKGKLTIKGILEAPGFENAKVMVHLLIDDKEERSQPEILRRTNDNEVRITTDAPATAGEIKVTLKVDPLPGEVTQVNNQISTFVTVTQEGLSVLLVDQPRFPEPQLICDALSQDPRIRLYTAWRRTDAAGAEGADLFQFEKQHYDVIILGDVSAKRLSGGNQDVLKGIYELVRAKGAGLLMMGGYETFANSDWKATYVEDLLPVNLNEPGQVDDRWRMEPTPEGLSHYVMRLSEKPELNKALWQKLPELDGMTKLGSEKRGATVLAIRAGTKDPVLVSQSFGKGRTMAFAGDTTWRWQRLGQPKTAEGVEAHARFWKQVVLWLARQDEAEGNVWVKLDARRLAGGSKLGLTVGLRGKGGVEQPDAHFDVTVVGPQGVETPVPTAREDSGERGTFWKTDAPGEYRLVVKGQGKDFDGTPIQGTASARFMVYQDDAEMVRRAADHEFLGKLAHAGGGKFYKAEELARFLQDLQKQPLPQAKPKTQAWPDWRRNTLSAFRVGIFLLFAGLVCLEWLLRRFWGLV